MRRVVVHVPGMTCRQQVRAVTARVRDLPGVVAVEADPMTGRLVAHGDITRSHVLAAVRDTMPTTVTPPG